MAIYVVTGANRGIGLEFVVQLSLDSANTIIACTRSSSSDNSGLEALNKHKNIYILTCDISSLESVRSFAKNVSEVIGSDGKIDYLLNNAAIQDIRDDNSLEITEAGLVAHIKTNVLGPAEVVRSLLPHLQRGTVVMNMTSGIASMTFGPRYQVPTMHTTYSISKAALNMLTVHQASDFKKSERGVIVICMDPGWVKTRMGGDGALMEKEDSVRGILQCLRTLTDEDSGKFYYSSGEEIPW
ncbi:NADP-dependent dehydrogenase-like protein [Bisporella sp. PMI_857]|nr:NADP-dependent dehydrogenase-like protein [Bisporella sp. PMI_857]